MMLLGVDVGTTHCKAGLVAEDGNLVHLASRPTETRRTSDGLFFYAPEALWQTVAGTIQEVTSSVASTHITAVGIASMAETGLLVDGQTGEPRTDFIPWFDTRAMAEVARIWAEDDAKEQFQRTGLPPSFKYALPKLLWLQARNRGILDGAVWLSAADYIAYRLTGQMATDYTLAARTYAFDVEQKQWATEWLRQWHIPTDLFPRVLPSGQLVGRVHSEAQVGLAEGTPVAVCGHDHLCAAFAAGAIKPGVVFDSMGTAESLVGMLPNWNIVADKGRESGLAFGRHVAPNCFFWLGGLPASGGSVEWLRQLFGDELLTYDALQALISEAGDEPTGILYFPYLSGSGAPRPDSEVRGAFAGLSISHGRPALAKAVLEGTAYEMEAIRRSAQHLTGQKIERIVAAGGGTKNRSWLQIKANISGCPIQVPPVTEASVLGAALLAAVGGGIFSTVEEALSFTSQKSTDTIYPDAKQHQQYQTLFEQRYLPLQEPLRASFHRVTA
jgi:sugar (pentulose or hexulose) kinase